MIYHVPSYESTHPSSILNDTYWYWVLAWVICCFYCDCPCTVIWKHTSIIHTQSHIMVLGVILGHMLFLWWMTMYSHMKAYIHHPYSITHIGIGSWLGPYVVFMVTDHVPSYESIHPSSILHHAYWHWVMAWVICFFCWRTMYWHISIIHTQSRILYYIYILGLGLGHVMFLWRDVYIIYMYIYIPNTQYQKEKYHIKRSRFC